MPEHGFKVTGQGPIAVGHRTSIGEGAEVVFLGPGSLTIGDYCTIGPGVRFVINGGDVVIGDWTWLYHNALVLSTAGVSIGQHGWFGQYIVLDGSGGLSIGHGGRFGMYTQVWSHVASGERIEGCTLFGMRPVTIANDVWLVGSCIVASGVSLGERLVALIGSNITKSFPGHVTIAGIPAAERPNLSFFKPITMDEKMALLDEWLKEFAASHDGYAVEAAGEGLMIRNAAGRLLFTRTRAEAEASIAAAPDATVCCIESKRYTKRLTETEQSVLKYLANNKARFLSWGTA